jgi:hypothetical protein
MNHQKRVYDSILELAANVDNPTPIVRLHHVLIDLRFHHYGFVSCLANMTR